MEMNISLIIEGLVSILLLLTIGYCMVLNRRLKLLRADESVLRNTISDLTKASLRAEEAIAGLRIAAGEAETHLAGQTRHAHDISRELAQRVGDGQEIVKQLAAITRAARPSQTSTTGASGAATRVETPKYHTRGTTQGQAA
ncbi:MAG: DUF6468 domain-containing protein [Fimbriimonadaceae bacterium]|nr:DUF6468 domain-containing protein [Alphaproteobacteria bacterium]